MLVLCLCYFLPKHLFSFQKKLSQENNLRHLSLTGLPHYSAARSLKKKFKHLPLKSVDKAFANPSLLNDLVLNFTPVKTSQSHSQFRTLKRLSICTCLPSSFSLIHFYYLKQSCQQLSHLWLTVTLTFLQGLSIAEPIEGL